ncbi:MAG: phytanoyl-CoA dioxygenase [Streptosporangiales bacterium]|nr:phytanoyl-CoA dioxygenase [Streptosporangiales bacterium]
MDDARVDRFLRDGFVVLRGAVPGDLVERCREILWRDLPEDPDDPSTWTRPVARLGGYAQEPFRLAANTPVLRAAYDRLAGAGRWAEPGGLGTFPVRFPHPDAAGDDGWHIEGSYAMDGETWPFANVFSRGRLMLLLFLFSDVSEDDAPTRVRIGSHLETPRHLQRAGEAGLSVLDVCTNGLVDATAGLPEALVTGRAGDVFLCHPFLVHAAQSHRGRVPRVMAQPPLLPRQAGEEVRLERPDGDYSPVEIAIRRGLADLL